MFNISKNVSMVVGLLVMILSIGTVAMAVENESSVGSRILKKLKAPVKAIRESKEAKFQANKKKEQGQAAAEAHKQMVTEANAAPRGAAHHDAAMTENAFKAEARRAQGAKAAASAKEVSSANAEITNRIKQGEKKRQSPFVRASVSAHGHEGEQKNMNRKAITMGVKPSGRKAK